MKKLLGVPVTDYLFGAFLFLFTLIYLLMAYGYEAEARAFPAGVAWVMLVLTGLDLVLMTDTRPAAIVRRVLNPVTGLTELQRVASEPRPLLRQATVIGWIFGVTALMFLIGILYAVPVYVFAYMRFSGRLSYALSLSVAVGTGIAIWVLFALMLNLDLYPGMFFDEF